MAKKLSSFERVIISPSLLENVTIHPVSPRLSLGMEEWTDCHLKSLENQYSTLNVDKRNDTRTRARLMSNASLHPTYGQPFEHAPKQPHPDYLQPPPTKKRFQTLSSKELEKLSTPFIPKNTETSTKWAIENFHQWLSHRNSSAVSEDDKCPESLLTDMDSTMLNKWLAVFVAETRKVNGEPYPPATRQLLLSGILRYMRSIDPQKAPNIFEKKNPAFKDLHSTMDSVYKKLRSDGVGAEKHSAVPFSKMEENELWEQGVIGKDSPTALLRAVFFYNGKNFCLRGGDEHRSLKLSQFKRTQNGYIYTENASKNRQGGLGQLNLRNKTVEICDSRDAGDRCHCKMLDLYISKLPAEAKSKDLFYVRPLEQATSDQTWYYSAPVGRNRLSKMVSGMCKLANIPGHHTNHSLRATGATELYTAGVPEKIIQERTGHRSIESLRTYEHTSAKQQLAVSKVLSSKTEVNFHQEIDKLDAHYSHTHTNSAPSMTFNNCQVSINYNNGQQH